MRARYGFIGRIAAVALTAGAAIGACAEGSDLEEPTAGTGAAGPDAGTGGSTIPPGQIGGPCETQEDCVEGTCTEVGNEMVCTRPCPPTCPAGTYCAIIKGQSICVPDLDQLCEPCKVAVDCKSPSDQCLTAPLGDKFCAIDCSTLGTCPNGFSCLNAEEYASSGGSGGGGGMDGGSPDAGSGGMDDGGSGDAGNGGSDGGPPMPNVPTKFCVPNSGYSCPCNKKRDGVKHACGVENMFGACTGSSPARAAAKSSSSTRTTAARRAMRSRSRNRNHIRRPSRLRWCYSRVGTAT